MPRKPRKPKPPLTAEEKHLRLVKGDPKDPRNLQDALLDEKVGILRVGEPLLDPRASLAKAERLLEAEDFEMDVVSQVEAIHLLQFGADGGVEFTRIKNALLKRLDISPQRFSYILEMPRRRDIREALEYEHVFPFERAEEEAFYPVDGWLGLYLQYAENSEVPLSWHFWCGVAALGAAMRRNVYCNLGYHLYPNHYVMLVGDSAAGKGWALGNVRPLIETANKHCAVALSNFPGGVQARMLKIVPDKSTAEQVCDILKPVGPTHHPSAQNSLLYDTQSVGLLATDEFSTLITPRSSNPQLYIRLLTKFYTCDDYWDEGALYRGVNRLRDLALTFISGSTIEWLNTGITEDFFTAGFMSRFLFIPRTYDDRFFPQGAPVVDPVMHDALARHMVPWMLCSDVKLKRDDPQTMRIWEDFRRMNRDRIRNPTDARMIPYWKRAENHVMKLAMVLEASSLLGINQTELDKYSQIILHPENLELAIRILAAEEGRLPACFEKLGQREDASELDIILECVRTYNQHHGLAMKTNTELGARVRRRVGALWKKRVDECIELGFLRYALTSSPSGRGPKYQVVWCPEVLGPNYRPPRA